MWDLWWTKLQWGRFYPSTSVSPASHSTDCSTLVVVVVVVVVVGGGGGGGGGWYSRQDSGRRIKWIQPHRTPRNLKKYELE
jgi:hypothetical protein